MTNDHVSWLQVSVDVALRMETFEAVRELKGTYDGRLSCELALLETLLQLLEVVAEELHDQVVIVSI